MAWIESHQSLGNHPKLLRLAHQLNIDKATAIGHLHYIWWWALTYAIDGDLSQYSAKEISLVAYWSGDPDIFLNALIDSGWLVNMRIKDWADYTRKWRSTLERSRRFRKNRPSNALWQKMRKEILERDGNTCRYCGGPGNVVDHVVPTSRGGRSTPENMVTSCRQCNSSKADKLLTETGLILRNAHATVSQPLTKPNLTKPNLTKPKELIIPEDLLQNRPEIEAWLAYKRERGQSYRPRGLDALWAKIRALPVNLRKLSIEQSMANNWSGIFPPNGGVLGQAKLQIESAGGYQSTKKPII